MPRPEKPWSQAEAEQQKERGQTFLAAFFAPPPRGRGRPPGPQAAETRGRPSTTQPRDAAAAAGDSLPQEQRAGGANERVDARAGRAAGGVEQEERPPPAVQASASKRKAAAFVGSEKAQRVNYSSGEALDRLTKAVNDWDHKTGDYEEGMDRLRFAQKVGIPYDTFKQYVCESLGKRKLLGCGVGRKAIINGDTEQFAVDVLRMRDRGNEGLNRQQGIDMIQELAPHLQRKQAERAFDRRVRQKHSDELTGAVKAQASTTKRSAITVEQQFRWHSLYDRALAFLREKNTGAMPDGRSFGEVAPYFILGGDETGLLASNGDVQIIGDKEKKKHEVRSADSRLSITMYRSGSAAGNDGPTMMLPPGKKKPEGWTDEFLVKHGAAPGSTVVMTETGYMTELAWIDMAPSMTAGIRKMPVICDAPDHWWVLKIVDGFGAHTSSLAATKVYERAQIALLKEEGDSSHVNQAYDQEVAKSDKRSMRSCLSFLRSTSKVTKTNSRTDAAQLMHVGLAMIRQLAADTWIHSFKKVNLHPHHRVPFPEWCERIAHFLQGGQTFKAEHAADPYALLPGLWHGMQPSLKKQALAIKQKHGSYSTGCVQELSAALHVPLSDLQNLRVCIELAEEHPSHLDRLLPEASTTAAPSTPSALAQAHTNLKPLTHGLRSFELHPKRKDGTQLLTGLDKFDHLVKLAKRSAPQGSPLLPSQELDVHVSATQRRLLNPTAQDYSMNEIAKSMVGEGATQNMAQRKIDTLGNLSGQCTFLTDSKRMDRMKEQLDLAKSIGELAKEKQNVQSAQRSEKTSELVSLAPAAVKKLEDITQKAGDMKTLTMKEMAAIAFVRFNGVVLSGNKDRHAADLNTLIRDQPGVLSLNAVRAPARTAAAPANAAPADAEVDNTTAGGIFDLLGREPNGSRQTVVPPAQTESAPGSDFNDESDDEEMCACKAMERQLRAEGAI